MGGKREQCTLVIGKREQCTLVGGKREQWTLVIGKREQCTLVGGKREQWTLVGGKRERASGRAMGEKGKKKKKKRGHPDLNRGPLDLQSNALPLSYTPMPGGIVLIVVFIVDIPVVMNIFCGCSSTVVIHLMSWQCSLSKSTISRLSLREILNF